MSVKWMMDPTKTLPVDTTKNSVSSYSSLSSRVRERQIADDIHPDGILTVCIRALLILRWLEHRLPRLVLEATKPQRIRAPDHAHRTVAELAARLQANRVLGTPALCGHH
jgi:hypothetical protein